ncbi:MAG: MotA/TolQ/ExbB proton channel family protein [Candidatus Obscuribacterales bacterium]|nr:MotA/TolQ/ExbB proton channel family protein [Steroidobacteraceae bacterium]
MFEIVKSGGIFMVPIILASVVAAAIFLERLWTLQRQRILPQELAEKVWRWVESDQLQDNHIAALAQSSPLGQVLAAGLAQRHRDRAIVKEAIEDTGRHVIYEMERFINALGTIAAIGPLLGLLGTVSGMIRTFNDITTEGVGNPQVLAGGISEALICTAAGLLVAIPATIGYRYLRGRVEGLVVGMEKEAIKLVQAIDNRQASLIESTSGTSSAARA